jgi:hypothetical protein
MRPGIAAAQTWTRLVHLVVMRPWAIAAVQELLLVLHRLLPLDASSRQEITDIIIRKLTC